MFKLDPDLEVIREIVSDSPYGDWYTPEQRNEFIHCLGRVLAMKGGYDKVSNDLMYSYWKTENSARMMAKDVPDDMQEKSMENAWDILHNVNIGKEAFTKEFVSYIHAQAAVNMRK